MRPVAPPERPRPVSTSDGRLLERAMPSNEWEHLKSLGRQVSFPKGHTICTQGSLGSSMYLIKSGRVEISVHSAEGHKNVLNQIGPGEILGEIALLDGGPRSADATAASDTVEAIAIDQATVFQVLTGSPKLVTAMIQELCRRVRNASDMFEVKSEKNAKVRLARAILRLSAKWGEPGPGGSRALTGFSQSDIGDFAGLARENVNRHLKNWAEEGIIERSGDGITILDPDAIADEAQL